MFNVIKYICVLVFFKSLQANEHAKEYTTKWDDINIDEILGSERLLKNYVNCLMDEGSCTPDGAELKKNLPDALKTECSRCSQKQKVKTEKVMDYLIKNKPEWWSELEKKYDPTGIYYKRRMAKKQTEKNASKKESAK